MGFYVAEISYPILGIDVLRNFNLLVDVRRQKLVDHSTSLSTPARISTTKALSPSFFMLLLEISSTVFCHLILSS